MANDKEKEFYNMGFEDGINNDILGSKGPNRDIKTLKELTEDQKHVLNCKCIEFLIKLLNDRQLLEFLEYLENENITNLMVNK